ncbi:transmembrane [Fagus crenata]
MQLEEVTADITTLSYWLNWRVLLCAVWVLMPMVIASFMIRKYESLDHLKSDRGETQQDIKQIPHYCKAWRPCLKEVHPIWLLAFRLFAFCLLLGTLIVKVVVNGAVIFYYYTQWTFSLLTIYFGCGSLLSIYGCYHYHLLSDRDLNVHHVGTDEEQGSYVPLTFGETTNISKDRRVSDPQEKNCVFQAAGILSYVFEVMFQMNAGAVMLTDSVYRCIIFPFLTIKDYDLNVRVPFFRISFFVLWTGVYVIVQWIIHACVSIWWPYPFLDLSSPYAPLWYVISYASGHLIIVEP